MAKHSIKVLDWKSAYYRDFSTSLFGKTKIQFQSCILAYPQSLRNNYRILECNMLEQHPETMGFEEPSFRIPNGTRLNPVDAYSADGVIIPMDQKGYIARMGQRGARWVGEWLYVTVGPGERYRFVEDETHEIVFFSDNLRDSSTAHATYGTCGWIEYHRKTQEWVSTVHCLFGTYPSLNNSRADGMGVCSYDEWLKVMNDDSDPMSWVYAHLGQQGWTAYSAPISTTTQAQDVPPVAIGNFDDLISQVTEVPWAQLARDAYNNIEAGFDGNGIALVSDLTNSVSSARDTAKAVQGLAGSKKAKALASIYLSFRYGWKLLMSDVRSLSQAMQRSVSSRFTRTTAQKSTTINGCNVTATYQVYYDKFGGILGDLSALDQLTEELDLEMNLGNLWDMVKYSFVLDWFADVGSVLESMDSFYNVAYRYQVLAAGKSLKVSRKRSVPGYTGSITETAYRRRYAEDAIPPSPLPATHQPRSQSWIDGAALVVQRI